MRNILKKICICGASLMMISSLGAGINNISARRVHRHARTHRVAVNSHTLYKQGEHDSDNYTRVYQDVSSNLASKIYKHIINKIVQNNFNKSYIKGLHLIELKPGGGHTGIESQLPVDILSDAKKVARYRRKPSNKDHHKNKHNGRYIHKSAKRIRRNNYKRNVKKSYRKQASLHFNNYYKQGFKEGAKNRKEVEYSTLDPSGEADNIINSLIKNHFNKSYIKGLYAGTYKTHTELDLEPLKYLTDGIKQDIKAAVFCSKQKGFFAKKAIEDVNDGTPGTVNQKYKHNKTFKKTWIQYLMDLDGYSRSEATSMFHDYSDPDDD